MKYNFFTFFIVVSTILSCSINNKNEDMFIKVDSIIIDNNFNGVVLIADSNQIVYNKAFGYSDLKSKTTLKKDDKFYIGSISKQITAVLILREFEKENLKLTDTISQYINNINQDWVDKVTIHQLLTHTHGIIELDQPLQFEQGTKFSYSQIGFGLLANILEKIHGKSFEKIATHFFEELGLKNTFHPDNKGYQNVVKSYEENEKGELIYSDNNPVKYIAAGGFISNSYDMLQWNIMLHSNQILKPSTLQLMKMKYATRDHPILDTIEYGYGLIFRDFEENIQVGAFGYAPGFACANYYYPQTKKHLIVLGNIATNLDDFRKTFSTHTELMNLIKNIAKDN